MCVAECVIAKHTSWMDDDDDGDGSDQLLLVLVLEDDFVAKTQNMPIKIVVCVIWVLYPVAYVRYPFAILNSVNMNVCMYVCDHPHSIRILFRLVDVFSFSIFPP